jgi:hypothetical protein
MMTELPKSRVRRRWSRPANLAQRLRPDLAVATEDATAPTVIPAPSSLAALLASHILRDGELIILILRPSLWFIFLQSLPAAIVVLLVALISALANGHMEHRDHVYFEVAALLIGGRVMWAILQWMGRLYILTDLRIMRLSGVFTVDIFDCPLRKVARTRLTATTAEKLLAVGSIEIEPKIELMHSGVWQTIANPRKVHEKVAATIARANQNGMGSG